MKAQISIEYLVVYTVAIGVIIGLVGTFAYLNNSPLQTVPTGCTLSTKVTCEDYQVTAGYNVTLLLKNRDLPIHEVSLNCSYYGDSREGSVIVGPILTDEEFMISCPIDSFSIRDGDKVKLEIALKYHLNQGTSKNWRYHYGSVIENAK